MTKELAIDQFVDPTLIRNQVKQSDDFLKKVVEQAFASNRDFLVHLLKHHMADVVQSVPRHSSDQGAEEWIEIDSLSKLRGLVGGRFESLKARWQGAGFPLKRKKGDKIGAYQIDMDGWIELESWIAKQGFLARQRPDKDGCLFEVLKN